jgi:hypothetical protein
MVVATGVGHVGDGARQALALSDEQEVRLAFEHFVDRGHLMPGREESVGASASSRSIASLTWRLLVSASVARRSSCGSAVSKSSL